MGGWPRSDNKTISVQLDLTWTGTGTELGKIQQLTEDNLFDTRSQQIHVSMLAQSANVQEQFIPKNRKNGKFLQYEDLID